MTIGVTTQSRITHHMRDPDVVDVQFRMSPVEKKAADLSAA